MATPCGHDVCLDLDDGRCHVSLLRCEGCRQGHYDLGGGVISNYPCEAENCECWFCKEPRTPAQARAANASQNAGGES